MSFKDTRAEIVHRRTYSRPKNDEGTQFETLAEVTDRIIKHQEWLWERALGRPLNSEELGELDDLWEVFFNLEASPAGRTRWLGGTDVARTREASQFNCSFNTVRTPSDVVDGFWLLLQGCGVGFKPETGVLRGFHKPVEVQINRSARLTKGGRETNEFSSPVKGEYVLSIGDSAESWARSVGKLLTLPADCTKLQLDFSQIRPAGDRLSGYGWISSGDRALAEAYEKICDVLNLREGSLLDEIDILDIMNLLGTTLSSRRSAEIALMDIDNELAQHFIMAKKDHWMHRPWRGQSNNSVLFWKKPSRLELEGIFAKMVEGGGSEPGFINGQSAKRRAPWFQGVNPCAEILLGGEGSFCNLVEIDLSKFGMENPRILKVMRLVARANYRQTCVDFRDGVLQPSWHETNDYLRLMGVGITGIAAANPSRAYLEALRAAAHDAAKEMADELGLPYAKAVTTVKPSGTLSKVMSTTEGVHKPLGKYIFNNVKFSTHDPLVPALVKAGYKTFKDPYDEDAMIVTFPVANETVQFTSVDGVEVNLESAVEQLERYRMLMETYVDHNCSVTISYDVDEIPAILDWLMEHWDTYVGVSWIFRNDPTKTAEDLGYPYLPQEVVTKEAYDAYVATLSPVDFIDTDSLDELEDDECLTGACPVK
jgi:adenosylcobalamin-dependent ribonucleoside-triphosphate reductase